MRGFSSFGVLGLMVVVALVATAGTVNAQDSTEDRLKALEDRLQAQDAEIHQLREQLSAQEQATETLDSAVNDYLSKVEGTAGWQGDEAMQVTYHHGTAITAADKKFQIKFGGRIMWDGAIMDPSGSAEDTYGKFDDGFELRRSRIFFSGTVYERVYFKWQYNFSDEVGMQDMYIGLKKLPAVGHVQVGNQKAPFSLEELTSSKYITFMERALGNEAFSPGRKVGIQVFNTALEDKLIWQVMWVAGSGTSDILHNNWVARVAGTPYVADDGKTLLHLGVSAYRNKPREDTRFRNRPEMHLAPRVVDTMTQEVKEFWEFGFEAAYLWNAFSAQAEWIHQNSDLRDGSASADSIYIYASYFLIGGRRSYAVAKGGAFQRPKIEQDFLSGDGNPGAWEVALRWSMVDLGDYDVAGGGDGGKVSDWTAGLNWYLNDQTRVMFNVVFSDPDDGKVVGYMVRFQIDF